MVLFFTTLLVCSFVCTFVVVLFNMCRYLCQFSFINQIAIYFERSNYETFLFIIFFCAIHYNICQYEFKYLFDLVSKEAVKNNILHLRFTYISIKVFLSRSCTKTNIFVLQKSNIIKKYTAPKYFKHIIKINDFFFILQQ